MLKTQLKTLKKRKNYVNRYLKRNKKRKRNKKSKSEINHESIIIIYDKIV